MNMQKEKRICAAVMFWLFTCFYAVAQQTPNPFVVNGLVDKQVVHSPEVTAMIRNISYPINYSTGVPDITIPIYEVKCGDLTLPITLSYHASGIKPNEPSNWVGQGWSLNAEPIISRKVNGHVDKFLKCETEFNKVKNNIVNKICASNDNLWEDIDTQPDEFYYKLPEKSGMFIYCQDKDKFLPIPYNNYGIETRGRSFNITDDHGTIYKFDGGVDYSDVFMANIAWRCSGIYAVNKRDSIVFGYSKKQSYTKVDNKADRIVIVDDFRFIDAETKSQLNLPRKHYTDWRDIVSEYFAGYEAEEVMKSPIVRVTNNGVDCSYQVKRYNDFFYDHTPMDNAVNRFSNTRTSHVEYIYFNGGKVKFTISYIMKKADTSNGYITVGGPLLDKIEVFDSDDIVVKEIDFEYLKYFKRIAENNYQSKAFLQKVIFKSSEDRQTYEFAYNEYEFGVPFENSRSIDFWGYYNGREDDLLIPQIMLYTKNDEYNYKKGLYYYNIDSVLVGSTASRSVNEYCMKMGTIKSIKYPTGAIDEFEFEANRTRIVSDRKFYKDEFRFTDFLKNEENNIYKVGGLRIKQIKTTTPNGSVNLRTFTYGKNEDGLGYTPINNNFNYFVLEKRKYYYNAVWKNGASIIEDVGLIPPGLIHGYYITFSVAPQTHLTSSRYRIMTQNPIIPITYEGDVCALYDCVTEYNGTVDKNNGKTIYIYNLPKSITELKNGVDFEDIASVQVNYANDKYYMWKYNELENKTVYKKTSTGYEIVNTIQNLYDINYPSVGKMKTWKIVNYALFSHSIMLDDPIFCKKVTTFSLGNEFDLKTGYKQLKSTIETKYTDDGRKYTTETHYGYTSNPNVTYPISKTIISLNDTVSREEYKYPAQITNTAVYNEMVSKNILSPVVYKKLSVGNKTMETQNVFTKIADGIYCPTSVQVKFGEKGNWETRLENKYNSFGKLVESVKDGKECVSYLYGYNGNNCIATVVNVRYDNLLKQTGGYITSLYNKNVLYDSDFHILSQMIKGTHYTLYQYKPLIGLSAKYLPNGTTMLYDYDGLGRLKSESIKFDGKTELLKSYNYNYENK